MTVVVLAGCLLLHVVGVYIVSRSEEGAWVAGLSMVTVGALLAGFIIGVETATGL